MEAVRQHARVENNILTLRLPESFTAKDVDVIVLPAVGVPADAASEPVVRRRPSPKLKGTRISWDLTQPVVPESDWDVLK